MIDTLRLQLSESEIISKNKLKIQPPLIDGETGEIINNYPLFMTYSGNRIDGTKAFYNDDKIQVTIIPGFDVKYLKETGDIFNQPDSYIPKIFVQCSLPKQLHDNNIKTLNSSDSYDALKALETNLIKMGIKTDIFESKISRMDTAININTKYDFVIYNDIFKNLNCTRKKSFEYAGTTFLFRNTLAQICIYDKIQEIKNQGINFKSKDNLMRLENRLLKKRKILDSIGISHTKHILNNMKLIKKNFEEQINKNIFYYSSDQKLDNLILTNKSFEEILEYFQTFGGRNWFDKFLKSLSYLYLNDSKKLYNLDKTLELITKNRMQKTRIKRKLNELNFHAEMIKNKKLVTNNDLYKELKDKFNKAMDDNYYES